MSLENLSFLRPGILTKRVSSYDRSGGNNDFVRIEAGETKSLAILNGGGVIKHIWNTLACDDPMIRRNAVLRMFWDGEDSPSVEAPLGSVQGRGLKSRTSQRVPSHTSITTSTMKSTPAESEPTGGAFMPGGTVKCLGRRRVREIGRMNGRH